MKLPKGIKKMRAAGSEGGLSKALDLTTDGGFNGYIRTTAPKGVKEASVVLFLDGRSKIAVYQSPQRSLYGPDALHEVKRISRDPKSTIRVEEFLAQNLEEVNTIVKKMRKAHVEVIDIERILMGIDVEVEVEPTKAPEAVDRIEDAIERELDEEEGSSADEPEDGPVEEAVEQPSKNADKTGGVRAKVTERITKSQEASVKDDDEFLRMIQEAGMSPPGEEEAVDDEVNQYIAAFEDFIQRSGDEESDVQVDSQAKRIAEVDEIFDQMLEEAADDPKLMQIIEEQRERTIERVMSEEPSETAKDRHDRLSEQRVTLEHISSTFSEVLATAEAEAERKRKELDEKKKKGADDDDLLEDEEKDLAEETERHDGLQSILERVMETHHERLEGAEMDMFDEEAAIQAEASIKDQKAKEQLDLEKAKEEFVAEMRSRIRSASLDDEGAPGPGKVADAVHGVSDGLQEKVDKLEQEQDLLDKERQVLEKEAGALQDRVDTMTVDMEVEVQARLRDLEAKEEELKGRAKESEEISRRLEEERAKVEKDLEQARSELKRVEDMEATLKDRELLLQSREKELDGKHEEVDGLKDHLEEEIATRASELEELEIKLKAHEKELLAKEREITSSMEAVKKERQEGVEADLGRLQGVEEELRKREEEYSSTIASLEAVIQALREELRENIENVEALEDQLKALNETEARVKELEEQLATVSEDEGASDKEKEELRKLLAYLDDLLSKLPEKEIEKFSKTEYFELYGRVLDRLGI